MTIFEITFIVLGALLVVLGAAILIIAAHNKKKSKKAAQTVATKAVETKSATPEVAATAAAVKSEPETEPVTEPIAEPVVKPVTKPITQESSEQELSSEQIAEAFHGGEVTESDSGAVVRTASGAYVYLRYDKSFTAKLIQAKDEVREYYNQLKNFVSGYKKVTTRISWKQESVNNGRNKICRLVLRGKSLYVYLPLNSDDYADTKYKVEHAEAKRFEEFPCLYRIKNARRTAYATELIATVADKYGLQRVDKPAIDFVADYPYEETLPLVERGLIKVVRTSRQAVLADIAADVVEPRQEVAVHEVNNLMTDAEAELLTIRSERKADTTKKGIVNVDVLSKCFTDGETVTLDEIKKRVTGFDKKVTYVKVLARGVLNKKLTVEADDFSVEAQKMILLMGGQVIKTLA